jgi:hypothetical protein
MEQTKNDHQDGHPKGFKIIIDNKPFEWPEPTITGEQIKGLVKAKPEYGVWLVVPGPGDDEEIGDHQNADLTAPGRERFITGPKQTTEGEGKFLPSRDRAYLAEKGIAYEEIIADGQRGVVLRQYPLPAGIFNSCKADILIIIPPGYPDTPPDMFHLIPWVRLTARNAFPRAADQSVMFNGQSWQRWSRHNNEWRPGVDGIWSMLKLIDHALKVAA